MSNKISYKEFINLVNYTHNDYSFHWRYGQAIMNVLHGVWPEKYNEILSGEYDCFYDDGIVRKTLTKLEKEWI